MITIKYNWTTEHGVYSKCVSFDTEDDLHALELADRIKQTIYPADAVTTWFDFE
jgi:hypothetical protein